MKKALTLIFITIILSCLTIYGQDLDYKTQKLYQKLNELDSQKDYKNIVLTLLELFKLNPENHSTKRTFEVVLDKYKTQIFSDEELMDTVLNSIEDIALIPVSGFISFYYNSNDVERLNKLLYKITLLDTNQFSLDDSFLAGLDPQINNKSYNLIREIVTPYSKTRHTVDKGSEVNLTSAQQKYISMLFEVLPSLDAKSDYKGLTSNLTQILKIDPRNKAAKKELISTYFKYKDLIITDEGLLTNYLLYLDDETVIPDSSLITYYYNRNDSENINRLLNRIRKEEKGTNQLDLKTILSLNKETNPELFDKIITKLSDFIKFSSPLRGMVLLYQSNNQDKFTMLINRDLGKLKENEITTREILTIDPEINIDNFKALFPLLIKNLSKSVLDTIQQPEALYKLAKFSYMSGQAKFADYFLSGLSNTISKNNKDNKKLLMWAIGSISKKRIYRAQLFLDQIYAFGTDEDLDILKRELTWWRDQGFAPDYINPLLNKYFGISSVTTKIITENTDTIQPSQLFGNYYALIIGIENYDDKNIWDLKYPVSDANSILMVLTTYYTFKKENIIFLKNPTRNQIISKFYELRKMIGENDNLLVFYAGHGVWDSEIEQGYWLPKNSKENNTSNWLSNSEIRDLIKGIKSKHSLLIADACFAGSIFKTREPFISPDKSVQSTYQKISRQAITSGALKTVPDRSVFIKYLLKYLSNNKEKYLPAQRLFLEFKDAVVNNSLTKQVPRFGVIYNSGDEGGDFIFIMK